MSTSSPTPEPEVRAANPIGGTAVVMDKPGAGAAKPVKEPRNGKLSLIHI